MTRKARVPGRISLFGLRCDIEPNVHVLVDVSIAVDLAAPAASDALEDAVDLAALAETARRTVIQAKRTLLEAVAVDIAREVLAMFGAVEDVDVAVRKIEPAGLDAAEERVQTRLYRSTVAAARE